MTDFEPEMQPHAGQMRHKSRRGRGRPPTHGLYSLKKAVGQLTTRRLDGRSRVAVAVRRWKSEVRADLGGDLSRAQETILEAAAQSWVIVASLDDWIARQGSLVSRRRRVLDVVMQRQQLADAMSRNLERLGLERKTKTLDVAVELAALHRQPPTPETTAVPGVAVTQPATTTEEARMGRGGEVAACVAPAGREAP